MKAWSTILILIVLTICLAQAAKKKGQNTVVGKGKISTENNNGKRRSYRKIQRNKKNGSNKNKRPNKNNGSQRTMKSGKKSAAAKPSGGARMQGKAIGEGCSYVVLSDLVSKGTGCTNGAKFVIKPGKNARRQYVIKNDKVLLLWVTKNTKFTACTSFTDETASVTCKAVVGLSALDLSVTASASATTAAAASTAAATTAAAVNKPSWGYSATNGPATWKNTYPKCGGSSQSPLDLDESTAVASNGTGQIIFDGYEVLHNATVSQNGHTFTVVFPGAEAKPSIQGGALPAGEVFEFAQLHLHWGTDDTKGSEHRLKTVMSPAEIHLVHWNKKYGTFGDAVPMADGLAVVGFFYQVAAADNPSYTAITDGLKKLAGNDNNFEVGVGNLALSSLIPEASTRTDYMHYKGSLTTPACYESVFWNVFTTKIDISESQMTVMRGLTSDTGLNLSDNFRPPQPLNGRTVFIYKK